MRAERRDGGIAAHFAARGDQRVDDGKRRGIGAVDQDRFGRAADAGAAHLGVDRKIDCPGRIGGAVDIEVIDPVEMREHRHARLVLNAGDQPLAAARNDDVDQTLRAEQRADRGAILCRHQLHRIGGQSGLGETRRERIRARAERGSK
jgi:hypothetical protein